MYEQMYKINEISKKSFLEIQDMGQNQGKIPSIPYLAVSR